MTRARRGRVRRPDHGRRPAVVHPRCRRRPHHRRRGLVRALTLAEVLRLRIDGSGDRSLACRRCMRCSRRCRGGSPPTSRSRTCPAIRTSIPTTRSRSVSSTERLDDVAFVGDVLVSSFNPRSLGAEPGRPSGGPDRAAHRRWCGGGGGAPLRVGAGLRVGPSVRRSGRGGGGPFARAVHDAGLLLGTWIVDEPARARALLLAGVDAVATNDPRAIGAACRDLLAS